MYKNKEVRHVLLRGLMGVPFSLGLDDLEKKTEALGIRSVVYPFTIRQQLEKQLIQEYKLGRLSGPVIITGHSLGAVQSVRLAKSLTMAGIDVRLTFLLDYVWTLSNALKFPKNKDTMKNNSDFSFHYKSRDGRVADVPGITENIIRYDLSHIELDNDEAVHKDILDKIQRLI